MQRTFAEILFRQNEANGYRPGDDAAHRAAAALADRHDAPTIAAIFDALAFAERVGGQFHVVTLREKFNDLGEHVADDAEGEWETAALLIKYESRDARIILAKPPEQVFGVPVTEFEEPPTTVEVSTPQPDELEDEPHPDSSDPEDSAELALTE
jgi:hypothetical protein